MLIEFLSDSNPTGNSNDQTHRFIGWRSYAKSRSQGSYDPGMGNLPADLQISPDQVFGHWPQVLRMGFAAGMG
jgi:hypothetical protein